MFLREPIRLLQLQLLLPSAHILFLNPPSLLAPRVASLYGRSTSPCLTSAQVVTKTPQDIVAAKSSRVHHSSRYSGHRVQSPVARVRFPVLAPLNNIDRSRPDAFLHGWDR